MNELTTKRCEELFTAMMSQRPETLDYKATASMMIRIVEERLPGILEAAQGHKNDN